MPLARIITSDSQNAVVVEKELRGLGYEVEVVSPGEQSASVADLEIAVEKCASADAVKRAKKLARQQDAVVFVAPAVLQGEAEAGPSLTARLRAVLARVVRRPQRVQTLSLSRAEHDQIEAAPAYPSSSGSDNEGPPAEAVSQVETPVAQEPEPGPPLAALPDIPSDSIAASAGASTQAPQPTAPSRTEAPATAAPITPEPAPVRPAKAGPEWVTHVAGLAGAALTFLGTIPQRLATRSSLRSARQLRAVPASVRIRTRDGEWKTAMAVATALAASFMLVWGALANRRPASPLPASVVARSADIQQQVPFGPVTLGPKPQPPAAIVRHAPARKPSPLHPRVKQQPKRRRRHASADDEEVIVRHFKTHQASAQAPHAGGVKRYSDLQ